MSGLLITLSFIAGFVTSVIVVLLILATAPRDEE